MVGRFSECATPRIKNHHGLGTGFDLCIQILDHRLGGDVENLVHQIRAIIGHGFNTRVVIRSAAFNHVAGQRPGATRKTDERHTVIQRFADLGNGIDDITQLIMGVRHTQITDLPFVTQRAFKLRAFAFGEVQTQAHGIRHGKNIGKQNSRV